MDTPETRDAENEWAMLGAQAQKIDDENTPESITGETVEDEPEIQTGELIAQVIQVTAEVIAPNWDLQQEECEQLGNVYGALLDKYLPDSGLEKYGLEISALMLTGIILKSRIGTPLKKPKEKQKSLSEKPSETLEQQVVNQTDNGLLMPSEVKNV